MLVLPPPVGDRLEPVAVAPGVVITVRAPVPLPSDRVAWRARVLGGDRVIAIEELETEAGWPLTLVSVPGALHAFFELFDRGVVASAVAEEASALDACSQELRAMFLAGDIDREQTEVVALSQLIEGL